jgi:hypothetical protein
MDIYTDEWNGCYDNRWKGLIIDGAFSHPAKFAHGLIRKIYQHAKEEGWLKSGDVVVDPFGGVGLGALYANKAGINWVGLELEQKFVNLGRQNIALWQQQFGIHWPDWGEAVLLQGDSRNLVEVLAAGAEMVLGSPPYIKSVHDGNGIDIKKFSGNSPGPNSQATAGGYGQSSAQLANLPEGSPQAVITSPPFAGNSGGRGEASRQGIDAELFDRHSGGMVNGMGETERNLGSLKPGDFDIMEIDLSMWTPCEDTKQESADGNGEDQLGAMPEGDIQATIGSPPFAESVGSDDPDRRGGLFRDPKRRGDVNLTGTYGETEGQLGGMPAGVISSPPFEQSNAIQGNQQRGGGKRLNEPGDRFVGSSENIGKESGETFWSAALTIVQQCYQILPPGGHAIWVVKDFVRNGERVEFSEQWRGLCESVGFRMCHIHRAMLVKNNGAQTSFDGDTIENVTERKSFFRRLHEAYTRANVHWQTLSRDDQASNLWVSKNDLWENYYYQLEQPQEEEESIKKPTKAKILSGAKMIAWTRDGKIRYKIDTSIDYEVVLCMEKI